MFTLLIAIAATSQTSLNLKNFILQAMRSEYRLKGKVDISTVAAAALKALVEKGVLKRDRDRQGYVRYVLAANATT